MLRSHVLFFAILVFSIPTGVYAHERHIEPPAETPKTPNANVVKETSPTVPKGIEYPEIVKLHPVAVHFGIALPILLLLLEIGYLTTRREPDKFEMLSTVLSLFGVAGAYATGLVAHESLEDLPITQRALELLHTHERIGLLLLLIFLGVFLMRILYRFFPLSILRYLYIFLILIGVGVLIYQGYLGGSLVYDFGVGVKP